MFQTFLAGFGGVGGACAVITLGLKVWPGALESLATGLYAHVNPERLPYNSVLSQHFAKTRQLGERSERVDGRLDELCRDTIKNTLISLIYGDQSHDHSEAVSYELSKLEKLDAQCWIVAAAGKILGGQAMMRFMIAGGTYLLLLALIIIFNHGAHKR